MLAWVSSFPWPQAAKVLECFSVPPLPRTWSRAAKGNHRPRIPAPGPSSTLPALLLTAPTSVSILASAAQLLLSETGLGTQLLVRGSDPWLSCQQCEPGPDTTSLVFLFLVGCGSVDTDFQGWQNPTWHV